LAVVVEPMRFAGRIRYWNPERSSGLAVVDVPAEVVAELGGLKQQRVHGRIASADFISNVMPAGGARLALSVSKAMMKAAGAAVGDEVELEITGTGGN
jgi:CO/xanthine dehydrogenase Mo-binding subunit